MNHKDRIHTKMKGKSTLVKSKLPRGSKKIKQSKKGPSAPSVCGICGKQFAQSRTLIIHMRRHNQDKPFHCHLCPKSFYRSDHLKNHVTIHEHKGNHPCDQCERIFKRADRLKYHQVNEHGSTISLNELRTYSKTTTKCSSKKVQCEVCGKSFVDAKVLKTHSQIHLQGHKYDCQYCGKSFNQKSNLNVHVRRHTGRKPYKCETCGERFITSSKLKTHARKHTGDLPFVCDVCGKFFGETHLLKMHKRIHDNIKPYVCTDCGRSFTHSSTLKSHMRTHTGAKPYKCDICQDSFAQISSLTYHRRIHTGEKPYMCDICGNKYTRQTTLNAHRSRHTGVKVFSCSQCEFKCDIENQLKKHVLHHHVITNLTTKSNHDHSNNANSVLFENNAAHVQLSNDSSQTIHSHSKPCASSEPLTLSGPQVLFDSPSYRETHGSILQNTFISAASAMQRYAISNCMPTVPVPWTSSSEDHSFLDINSGSDNLGCGVNASSTSSLTSDLIFQSTSGISSNQLMKSKGSGPSISDPTIVSSLTTGLVPSLLSQDMILGPPSDFYQTQMLPRYDAAFHVGMGVAHSSDKILAHPLAAQSEMGSQLYDLENSNRKSSSEVVPQTVSDQTSIFTRLPLNKPTLPSYTSSPEIQAIASSSDVSNQNLPKTFSMGISKRNEEESVKNMSNYSLPNKDDLKMDCSSIKDKCQETKIDLPASSRSDKQDHNIMDTENKDSFPEVQTSHVKVEEDMSDEECKVYFEQSSNTQPLPSVTKHRRKNQTPKSIKQKSFINTGQNLKGDIMDSGIISSKNRSKSKTIKKSREFSPPTSSSEGKEKSSQCKCQICGEFLTSKKYLTSHMKLHVTEDLQCSICCRKFTRSDHLKTHLLLHSKASTHKCFHCVGVFSDTKELEEHNHKMHNSVYPFQCRACQFSCLDILQLKGHVWQNHSDHGFSCPVCQFVSKTSKDLKDHMKEHPNEGAFDCNQCGMSFSQKSVLNKHVTRKHSGEKHFGCGICSDVFFLAAELNRHLRHHTGDRPFVCEICNKGFIDAKLLRIHARVHTGEKPFQCNQCGLQLAHSSSLRNHMRIHSGSKPYKCDLCGDTFTQRASLTCHQQIHDRQKMYTCDICGKSYTRRATLNIHLLQHSGSSRFSCQACEYKTNKASALKRHTEKWHKDVLV